MLVGTLTNIILLVKKFLGKKFIPRFAKISDKIPLLQSINEAAIHQMCFLGGAPDTVITTVTKLWGGGGRSGAPPPFLNLYVHLGPT